MTINTPESLRQLYPQPQGRAVLKQIAALDAHCRKFIALSPFLVLATSNDQHDMDASPRGGAPGFVKVHANGDLLLPDAPGNNRLDSLENIISTSQVGLLFMIPGFNETLRVNGQAHLSTDATDIALCTDERRAPKLVIRVKVQAAYLHCAKAFMRSQLWQPQVQVPRTALPTMGQMISDQSGVDLPMETQEEMERRYAADL
jgi:PPOX class probable FMN-dependent enzyme